jgi:hypothetical protein
MNLELSKEELDLIKMLLERELVTTRIEIHHARMSFEYRDFLKKRVNELEHLFDKVCELLSGDA